MMTVHAHNFTGKNQFPLALIAVVFLGMAATIVISMWIDGHRPPPSSSLEEEQLYVTGKTLHRMSLGFGGLVADWYWMRSLQYVGGKILSMPQDVEFNDLGQLNLQMLGPLLDVATSLDPEFLEPYEYSAVVLSAVDVQEAIRLTKKGIEANPSAWRLYHHLGYIYWQQHDFKAASEAYGQGARIPGAPSWMEAMKARMAAEGGSRNTAREIYARMIEQSSDVKVKEMARRRLLQLDSLEQREALQKAVAAYRARNRHCPASWKDLAGPLRSLGVALDESGAPLDPGGTPYVLRTGTCEIDLNPKSEVPYK